MRDCFTSMIIPDKWSKTLESPGSNVFPWGFIWQSRACTFFPLNSFVWHKFSSTALNLRWQHVCGFEKIEAAHTHFITAFVIFLATDCRSHYHLFIFNSVDTCYVTVVSFAGLLVKVELPDASQYVCVCSHTPCREFDCITQTSDSISFFSSAVYSVVNLCL